MGIFMKISFKSLAFVLFAFHGLTILLGAQESESLESLEQKFNDLEKRVSRFLQSDADTGEEAPATPPEAPSSQPVPALPEVPSPQIPAPAPPLPGTPPSQENDNQAQAGPIFTPVPQGDAGQDPADSSSPSDFDSLKESLDTVVRELEKSKEIISELTESGELDEFSSDLSPDLTAPSPSYSNSHEGQIGAYYTGLRYSYGYNSTPNSFEDSSHSLHILHRQPIGELFYWGLGAGIISVKRSDWKATDYSGPNPRTVSIPAHTAYEIRANALIVLHKQFNFNNKVINSIDPFISLNLNSSYQFENEYPSSYTYGYGYGIGIEIMFFNSFSVIPGFGKGKFWRDWVDSIPNTSTFEGTSSDWSIAINYFFQNGGFLGLDFWQSNKSPWKGIALTYAFDYN